MLSIAPNRSAAADRSSGPALKKVAAPEPPPADTNDPPPPGGKENRAAPRRPAAAFPEITGLRFTPLGIEARLINMSASGLLTECEQALKPGAPVTVAFAGTFESKSAEGRVARCVVSSVARGGRLRYHVAVAFKAMLPMTAHPELTARPQAEEVEAKAAAPVAAEPVATAAPEPATPKKVRNRW